MPSDLQNHVLWITFLVVVRMPGPTNHVNLGSHWRNLKQSPSLNPISSPGPKTGVVTIRVQTRINPSKQLTWKLIPSNLLETDWILYRSCFLLLVTLNLLGSDSYNT